MPVLRVHVQIMKYSSLKILSGGSMKFQTGTGTMGAET